MHWTKIPVIASCALLVAGAGLADAADRVINTQPRPDAAILPYGPGLKKIEYTTTVGNVASHNEGIVIRGSRIENGKIIIPPSGLYYTNRGPRSYQLRGDMLNILGKPYYLVYFKSQAGVLADRAMLPGDRVSILPDKVFELKEIKAKGNGHPTPVAHFAVYRPSGVPVGGVGTATTTPLSDDVRDFKLWGKSTGLYELDPSFRFDQHNYTSDLVAGAGKSIKVKDLTDEGLTVEEAVFHRAVAMYVTETAPTTGYYGSGDKATVGAFQVDIIKVDEKAGTARIKLTGPTGTVEKTLGPLDERTAALLTNSEWEAHEMLSLRDKDITVQVEMSPERRQGLFRNGKVALNLYENLVSLAPETPWPTDGSYLYRPDT